MTCKLLKTLGTAVLAAAITSTAAIAGPIEDRIAAGEPIRIGFANIPIWGFPDENGDAKGFVNEIALGILAEMGPFRGRNHRHRMGWSYPGPEGKPL